LPLPVGHDGMRTTEEPAESRTIISSENRHPAPIEINLHRKSRLPSIRVAAGLHFELPCEYLRVFSPAAEEKSRRTPISGKEQVDIDSLDHQGSYAVRIAFDDDHDTGIFSWESLHEPRLKQAENWAGHLAPLEQASLNRKQVDAGSKQLQLLYFAYLAKFMRSDAEQVDTPAEVTDVQSLLAWLRQRARDKAYLPADERVRVTVNKQFAEPFTKLAGDDVVALVPTLPNPPSPPKQSKAAGRDD